MNSHELLVESVGVQDVVMNKIKQKTEANKKHKNLYLVQLARKNFRAL